MTSLNVPNSITNGTVADATDVQQNFDAIESHVNTEVVNRDGSIAMTGELLLPSNPTSNLAASTKSYVDGKDSAMNTRVTALEGTDIVVTLTGDVTGTGTITNLGDVSFATTVVDDSHDHTIANVDGLQTALDGKLGSTAKAADSQKLDALDSTQFLRSDATDTATGNLTLSGTVTVGGTGKYLRFRDTTDNSHYGEFRATLSASRTYTFPNASGTVALTSDFATASVNYATSAGSAGTASSAATATYASTAGSATLFNGYNTSAFVGSSGRQTITNCGLTGGSYSGASLVLDASAGSQASISFYHYWNGSSYAPQIRSAANYLYFRDGQDGDNAILSVNKIESRNPSLNSSRTIKHDIEAFTGDATSIVDGLETVTFRYNDGDTDQQHLGFIAEDVATVFPMAVDQSGDTPTLNIAHIIALSVAGLQEANERIAQLETRIAELEAR